MASLTGARDAIRRMASRREPIRVLIADGTYRLSETLVFDPRDSGTGRSPIIYQAAAGAHPVFIGGRPIYGWRVDGDGRWRADVGGHEPSWVFEELWNRGRRLVRARVPDRGFMHMLDFEERPERMEAASSLAGRKESPKRARDTLILSADDFGLLPFAAEDDLSGAQVVVYHRWTTVRRAVEKIDPAQRTISIVGDGIDASNRWEGGTRFYLDNWPRGPHAPGQWYLSKAGHVIYWPNPGERMEEAEFIAPSVAKLIDIRGKPEAGEWVTNLTFRGLNFRYTQYVTPPRGTGPWQAANGVGACVEVNGATHIVFEQCELSHTGQYGIWFRNRCSECAVRHSLFHDLGAGALRIGAFEAANPDWRTERIEVDNNIIWDGGTIFPDAVGILVGQSSRNRITHNLISGFDYSGISVGWTWGYGPSLAQDNWIEYNRISHIGREMLSDLGGIYTLGISTGTVIANNVIHDIRSAEYGGWGIYLDEGSSGITVTRNLVYRSEDGGFHQHYGRENTVTNNIFAFGETGELRLFRPEEHRSLTFQHNIVYWDKGPLFTGDWVNSKVSMDLNLYWNGSEKAVNMGELSWDQWRENGHDLHSRIGDPRFIAPEHGDFRLRWFSPARRLGFMPFDYRSAGVYGNRKWVELAAKVEASSEKSAASGEFERETGSPRFDP